MSVGGMMRLIISILLILSFVQVYASDTVFLGRSSNEISKDNKRLTPIAAYLDNKLKKADIEHVKAVIDPENSAENAIKMLREGRLHIILESSHGTSHYYNSGAAKPILSVSRKGKVEYYSLFFVRKDSKVKSIDDLVGKTVAFEDRNSTSGFLLPYSYLIDKGFSFNELSRGKKPDKNKINYIFGKSELNISTLVQLGKVDAGILSSDDWINIKLNPENYKNNSTIIGRTNPVPSMFVSVSSLLSDKQVVLIKRVLLDMHKTEEGRKALVNFNIDKFVEMPGNWKKIMKQFLR